MTQPGIYTMTIGPLIADLAGNLMDQDQDGVQAEPGDDTYTAVFEVTDPIFADGFETGDSFQWSKTVP